MEANVVYTTLLRSWWAVKRILLVDDHKLVRTGVASLLRPSYEICGEAENGVEAIQKVRDLKPDLVLMDLSMPIMGGTEAVRTIRHIIPEIKIILLSMHESGTIAELARIIGADAYLSKGCSSEELQNTIASVLSPVGRG